MRGRSPTRGEQFGHTDFHGATPAPQLGHFHPTIAHLHGGAYPGDPSPYLLKSPGRRLPYRPAVRNALTAFGTAVSNPTTSSESGSFGSAMVNPVDVVPYTTCLTR